MDFLIELDDGRTLTYNTDPCTLTWEDGTPVDLKRFAYNYVDAPHSDNDQIAFSKENPVIGKEPPRILKVQLGLGCNYACSYCSQGGQKEEATSSLDAEGFSFDWVEGIPEKVEFWGGEPLLYWKKLEILVPKVRAAFGDVRMSLVTNGTLLTREKVDWLYEHGFSVAVSHDGPGQHLRGEDPLQNPDTLAVWRYLFDRFGERACINAVLTAENFDLLNLWMWFEGLLGTVRINVEDVVTDYGGAKMTDEQLDEVYRATRKHASSGLALVFPRIRWAIQQFLESLAIGKPLAWSHQVCGMDRKDQIAVDLRGNVLTCQNVGAESGHMIGTTRDIAAVRLDTATSFMNRPHCNECPVVHLCYGSCMFLRRAEFESSCHASYHYNRALLEGAVTLLTGCQVAGISGWKPSRRKLIPIKEKA